MDRKQELENKKKKLEEVRQRRKEKEKREEALKKLQPSPATGAGESLGLDAQREAADALLQQLGLPVEASVPVSPAKNLAPSSAHRDAPRDPPQLKQTALVSQINIPPKESVQYSKETQTTVTTVEEDSSETTIGSDVLGFPGMDSPAFSPRVLRDQSVNPKAEEKKEKKELTDEEKLSIFKDEDFITFITRSAKYCERMMEEDNLLYNYGINAADTEVDLMSGFQLEPCRKFYNEHWSKHRIVTALDWNSTFPELLLSSAFVTEEWLPNQPDGAVLVWNTKYKTDTPEYVFHCGSNVTSAAFAPFHSNLVIGGTYSGMVCIWDNRSYKRTPVQKTTLGTNTHTHPVFSVQVIGTQNAHNLLSMSNDGLVCTWNLDMLSQPQDTLELTAKQSSKLVYATCLALPLNVVNNFIVGTESGQIYSACRHGNQPGVVDTFEEGHFGHVTSVGFNSVTGPIDLSHLFVSSGFDYSVKLWSMQQPSAPLHTFEGFESYVYDCDWSPVNPAVFATADDDGQLKAWNMNIDCEAPVATASLDGEPAINKLKWSHNGRHIAVGSSDGTVHLIEVSENLYTPNADEWANMAHTLNEIRSNPKGEIGQSSDNWQGDAMRKV